MICSQYMVHKKKNWIELNGILDKFNYYYYVLWERLIEEARDKMHYL